MDENQVEEYIGALEDIITDLVGALRTASRAYHYVKHSSGPWTDCIVPSCSADRASIEKATS